MNELTLLVSKQELISGFSQHQLSGDRYIVSYEEGEVNVYSAICPHQGGLLEIGDNCVHCPLHGWEFRSDGSGINVKNAKLFRVPFEEKSGGIYIVNRRAVSDFFQSARRLKNVKVELLSHACIILEIDGFRLLFDPWLDGPAFYGSWIQYPPNNVDIADLKIDAIVVTHEHSDHFHENSLKQFDRNVSIYVPGFVNGRIEEKLKSWSFQNVFALEFGKETTIRDDIKITFFEPVSLWNDSILYLESKNCTLLNINDAGANHKIREYISGVDILLCQFNAGASGYPATWMNLSRKEKMEFYRNAAENKIKLLEQASKLYNASILIPFASFFYLWHSTQIQFRDMLSLNSPSYIKEKLENIDCEVIDLLPGDSWEGAGGVIQRKRIESVSDHVYTQRKMNSYADRSGEKILFEQFHPSSVEITPKKIEQYFLNFNNSPDIYRCEDINIIFETVDANYHVIYRHLISIDTGELEISELLSCSRVDLRIQFPANLFSDVVNNDTSWDEAIIGYWCRFSRDPDVYHQGFWKLVQAPYYKKNISRNIEVSEILSLPLAKILGASSGASRVLARHGLYCDFCEKREHETLYDASAYHGFTKSMIDSLCIDLLACLEEI